MKRPAFLQLMVLGASIVSLTCLPVLTADAGSGAIVPIFLTSPTGDDGQRIARFSARTLVLALEVDRESARLLAYTAKDRPFQRDLHGAPPKAYRPGKIVELEIALIGNDGVPLTHTAQVPWLCFDHPPDAPPHIAGDTITRHREITIVEVPEIQPLDRVEVSYYENARGQAIRRSIGTVKLDRAHFTRAGGALRYENLTIATPDDDAPSMDSTTGTVLWPEDFDDEDIYAIYGDPSEGGKRINVVIVPDGYTYADKSLIEANAAALVAYFRNTTPLKEHDSFFNYTLVYAYSLESGTDACDCDFIVDTAMGSYFPDRGFPCEDIGNRGLTVGLGCDVDSRSNIAAAELRAPVHDTTIVMVNTWRHGGTAGLRAVYAAGAADSGATAIHELGHSFAGLADEYGHWLECGTSASEINTSLNATEGAWPEWIGDLGAPVEGAQYYHSCVYRPAYACLMRSHVDYFCAVCGQRWALRIFGHPRIEPSAPIESIAPISPVFVNEGELTEFSVAARLADGEGVVDIIHWQLEGPGYPTPTTVATDTTTFSHVFSEEGIFTLTCAVIADTNFIKPLRFGSNRDVTSWTVYAGNDVDGDGVSNELDCDLVDGQVWSKPSEVRGLMLSHEDLTGITTLSWSGPTTLGCEPSSIRYNTLRSVSASDFLNYGTYLETDDGPDTTAVDEESGPLPGGSAYYLVGAENRCGEGPWETVVNLVQNGSMETWINATDLIDWLETTTGGTVTEETDPGDVYQGLRAVKLTRTGSGVVNIVNPGIRFVPGRTNSLSFVAKIRAALADSAQVRIRNVSRNEELQDNGSWSSAVNYINFDLLSTYQRYSVEFAVPSGYSATDVFQLAIRHGSSTPIGAELWLDDVSIQSHRTVP